jgi:hypothetical protein
MKNIFTFILLTMYVGGYSQSNVQFTSVEKKRTINQPVLIENSFIAPAGRFDLNFDFMPGMTIGGSGSRLGSIIQYFDEETWVVDLPENLNFVSRTDYGDLHIPIVTDPKANIPFNLDIGYTMTNTRLGLSWFRMSASNELSGMVPGLDFYSENQVEGFGYGFVSFWNMGWDLHASRNFPASWIEAFRDLDENEEGDYDFEVFPEMGNTLWEASHTISFNSFRLTVRHPIMDEENLRLSLVGGMQYGLWNDNLRQTLNITAHRDFTDKWTEWVTDETEEDSIRVEIFWNQIFHNDITLQTTSSSEFNSFGLLAGIEANWQILPSLFFSVSTGGSTLGGNASFAGAGIDIDDIVETDNFDVYDIQGNLLFTDPRAGEEFLSGVFSLPEYTRSLMSVNYYMNITARFHITNNVSITGGYSYSIWQNLPLSPLWRYSDLRTRPYGASALEESWDTERSSNISYSGFKIGIGLRF